MASADGERGGRIAVDRLDPGATLEVIPFDRTQIGETSVRVPHRHDYHELIWIRDGCGEHLLDGQPVEVRPLSVTVIGRGQVHVFQRAQEVTGAVVRFGDELLTSSSGGRGGPAWLLAGRGGRTVPVPPSDADLLDGVIAALAAEAQRPPDACSGELERHLISTILLWIERWYDAAHVEDRDSDDAAFQLYRRFAELLESDYARHHDTGHYADALAVPAAALSRALTEVTGRPTKELITDRVMLEAARLLRFTGLGVGEIAHAVGYDDPLYFSRAFKRHSGESPMAFRDRVRGRS